MRQQVFYGLAPIFELLTGLTLKTLARACRIANFRTSAQYSIDPSR